MLRRDLAAGPARLGVDDTGVQFFLYCCGLIGHSWPHTSSILLVKLTLAATHPLEANGCTDRDNGWSARMQRVSS